MFRSLGGREKPDARIAGQYHEDIGKVGIMYGPDGVWFAEGHGVDPDIPVVDDPTRLARGIDPQLVRAVEEVMRMIREDPVTFPGRPAWERRSIRR